MTNFEWKKSAENITSEFEKQTKDIFIIIWFFQKHSSNCFHNPPFYFKALSHWAWNSKIPKRLYPLQHLFISSRLRIAVALPAFWLLLLGLRSFLCSNTTLVFASCLLSSILLSPIIDSLPEHPRKRSQPAIENLVVYCDVIWTRIIIENSTIESSDITFLDCMDIVRFHNA